MRSVKRIVSTGFWTDSKVINQFSPEDKYFMLYLLTNQHTSQLGIYGLSPKQAAFDLGYSAETVSILLDRFETKYHVLKYNRETCEVAILNYLKHSIVKGGKPVMDCLVKEEKDVKDKSLLMAVYNHLKDDNNLIPTVNTFLEYIYNLYSSKYLTEEGNNYPVVNNTPLEKEKDNDIYNDNDNERNVPRNVTRNVPRNVPGTQKAVVDRGQVTDLYEQFGISEPLTEEVDMWLQYKAERKEKYNPTGLKMLIKRIGKHEQEYGTNAVINLIEESMSCNYQGIVWDRIQRHRQEKRNGGQDALNYYLNGGGNG